MRKEMYKTVGIDEAGDNHVFLKTEVYRVAMDYAESIEPSVKNGTLLSPGNESRFTKIMVIDCITGAVMWESQTFTKPYVRSYNAYIIPGYMMNRICGSDFQMENGFMPHRGPDVWSSLEKSIGLPIVSIRPSGREGWNEYIVLCAEGRIDEDTGKRIIRGNFDYVVGFLRDVFHEFSNDECEIFESYGFDMLLPDDAKRLEEWMQEEYDWKGNYPAGNVAYLRAYEYLRQYAGNEEYYEIVEDSMEYENGLMLIVYFDEAHESEKYHFCVDISQYETETEVGGTKEHEEN